MSERGLSRLVSIVAFLIAAAIANGATGNHETQIDVLHYSVTIEPDIAGKSVKGTVFIQFSSKSDGLTYVEFDCGDLAIDSVRLAGATLQFSIMNHRLKVSLPSELRAKVMREIEVNYHGTPKRGIRFF